MCTSFLSSIFPLDVGVALVFDILVKFIVLSDKEELSSVLIRGNWFEDVEEISWLEFELTSVEVENVWLLITPFRESNEESSFWLIKSNRPIGS
jgi:hypothetical protein